MIILCFFYQIGLVAMTKGEFSGDIAIDDVELVYSPCQRMYCMQYNEKLCTFPISIVPVGGWAPVGARESAGTVMTEMAPRIYGLIL